MKTKLLLYVALLGMLFFGACSSGSIDPGLENSPEPVLSSEVISGTTILEKDTLKKISSYDELKTLILKDDSFSTYQTYFRNDFAVDFAAESFDSVESLSAKSVGSGSSTPQYSQTNNQVKGVDEADIVKNDGKYIYSVSGNSIAIVDAYPTESSTLVSKIELERGSIIREFFIQDNQLILFTNTYSESLRVSDRNLIPYPHYEDQTEVLVYSIKSREQPELLKTYSITGSYYDARLMNNHVYFISQEYMRSYGDPIYPVLYKDGLRIAEPEIYYFNFRADSTYYSIGSLNLENLDSYNVESYLLEQGATFYMSENNIYFGYQKQFDMDYIEQFEETILPSIEIDQKGIFEKHIEKKDKEAIAITLEDYLQRLNQDELQEFMKEISKKSQEYQEKIDAERRKTVIHRLSIEDDGLIYYHTKGEVEGHLLNQFSMDEYNDNLRVATTTSYWIRGEGSHSYNNVYILDQNLEYVGWLEKLAEDERIYSTRFMGNKLYMVTFKQVDPLFVIDLSEPSQPRVLGELKIPGFSSYLHPYGENYLIGVGKETQENEWGGFNTIGVKLSLFDVSDVNDPKEVDKVVIGGRWSDTEVLQDHKAFLFDESKRLLVLPVKEDLSDEDDYYTREWFKGAYAFEVNENGFELLKKISHYEGKEEDQYSWRNPSDVRRSLWIDNVLYTVSEDKIIASDISNELEELVEIDLEYEVEEVYSPIEPYYLG